MPVNFLADESGGANILQVFHINLNCANLERTIAFYEQLGFRIVNEFDQTRPGEKVPSFAEIGIGPALGLSADCDARAALMALTDDPRGIRLDPFRYTQVQTCDDHDLDKTRRIKIVSDGGPALRPLNLIYQAISNIS